MSPSMKTGRRRPSRPRAHSLSAAANNSFSSLLFVFLFVFFLIISLPSECQGLSKSRHRHRRVPVPEPEPVVPDSSSSSAISRRLKEEQQQNKFKPEFKNCEEYRPEVEEESDRGRNAGPILGGIKKFKLKIEFQRFPSSFFDASRLIFQLDLFEIEILIFKM